MDELRFQNFESHVDSTVKLSPSFTVLVGMSHSGKTSALRALDSILTATWTPASVRHGATTATVTASRNGSSVTLKRGRRVDWSVNGNDKKGTGKNVPDEVHDVLGIRPVRLGSSMVMLNLQDQHSRHFLLSEVAGDKTTPSTAARIIDQLAGLDGLDEIVDGIAAIRTKAQADVRDLDKSIEETKSRMPDEETLIVHEAVLAKCEKLQSAVEQQQRRSDDLVDLATRITDCRRRIDEATVAISSMPNPDRAVSTLQKIESAISRHDLLVEVAQARKSAAASQVRSDTLNRAPVDAFAEQCNRLLEIVQLKADIQPTRSRIARSLALEQIDPIEYDRAVSRLQSLLEVHEQLARIKSSIEGHDNTISLKQSQLGQEQALLDDVMAGLEECPLCGTVLSKEHLSCTKA